MNESAKDSANNDSEGRSRPAATLPDELLIMPVHNQVVFPGIATPLMVSPQYAQMVEQAEKSGELIGFLNVKSTETTNPKPGQMHEVGTVGKVMHTKRNSDKSLLVIIQGMQRFRVAYWLADEPNLRARVTDAPEVVEDELEIEALVRNVRKLSEEIIGLSRQVPDEFGSVVGEVTDPLQLAYVIALGLNVEIEERQAILEQDSVKEKLLRLSKRLSREKDLLELGSKIQSDIQKEMTDTQRKYFLRRQMEAIKKELGEGEEGEASEAETYAMRIEEAELSEEARKEALRELQRLKSLSPQSPETPMIKTYLDWILDLPWNRSSEDRYDILSARRVLDEDHFGLAEVKERLIEYLAVRSLIRSRESVDAQSKKAAVGVILCLAGPPGVGKTSLGRSIARALSRSYTRMSLGGVRDEAEIRGHRRTYIGAMPGRIIQAIKRAKTRNPVFILDEIDKVGQDWRGDPSSALLEVLDPAQNHAFRDHYLDVDFDLSEVIFIATANQLDTIPAPLRDRMEIIQLDGYTELEKLQIAKQHLVPRQLRAHGLKEEEITFMDEAIGKIIHDYTREAGVRTLERQIAAVVRKAAVRIAEQSWTHLIVTEELVRQYLKKERFESQRSEKIDMPGVATGLAVTPAGGDILYVEATRMPGKGRMTLTGQLGDVMKESARIALSYVRANAPRFGIDPAIFDRSDVHLHVPAGALPKDGPSAGVAMVSALTGLFSDRTVRSDVGSTGEITLRGRVLPVGGVKMKVLAAHRAGLSTVVLPKRNAKDLDDLPPEVRSAMTFILADRIGDVLDAALSCGTGKRDAHPIDVGPTEPMARVAA
jgi:ATP-dependent Lon protease